MRIHVGTSGYNYPEWKGHFYPEKIAAKAMYAFYAERFHSVEINATFYRMPAPKTIENWRAQAPEAFTYALKAPRQITHDRRLSDCEDVVRYFVETARGLGSHLGPLLFQLPPSLRCDLGRLEACLAVVPKDVRVAFEFRHASWLVPEVYERLSARGAALCIADFGDHVTPFVPTAKHGYFRLRDEGYTPPDLERWADQVLAQADTWESAFVYFKHEEEGKGPAFARAFLDILRARGVTPV
jgi:uncharacterized protein YecE (DUF72 family)